jgi:hypothetical protein
VIFFQQSENTGLVHFSFGLQDRFNQFTRQADAEKPDQSRQKKNCLAMKKLKLEQMQQIQGGMETSSWIGLMCGATLVLACSAIFAPLAGATGAGCAVGLYAMHIWSK